MEKLIEYLNAYEEEMGNGDIHTKVNRTENRVHCYELDIISKREHFIEWLVNNDKINLNKFYNKISWIITDFDLIWYYFNTYNEIILALAIQDNPIDFLISILK